MPIIMRLDRVMADRKMSLKELSEKVGVANVNLSKMKTGKISAIRFSTLEAICDGFGITMSQFFTDGDLTVLTPEQKELFDKWVALTPEQKSAVYGLIAAFTDHS